MKTQPFPVGTCRLVYQWNGTSRAFMDIACFPVDSFADKFILCTKTKVGLATQGNHSIPGKFGLKQTRRPLVVGSGVSSRGNQFFIFHLETLLHIWFDHFFQTGSGRSHICRVSVHAAILEVRTIHKQVHEIVVKLQHPELGVLVDKTVNLHG
jgi:hypothetical protein